MNNQPNPAVTTPLATIDGASLMAQDFPPLQFAVDRILPHGIFILAGSGKIGKSWLSLDICRAVATGGQVWDFHADKGDVLYLALEDTYPRLQARLALMREDESDISALHLATASLGIGDGLIEQINSFLGGHPDTRLIVIDTLEHIRNVDYDKNMYSCDYRDMTRLRGITDHHNLTLLLVHHTRKMFDPDPLNTLSGSTGLVGSVDGVFVLEKATRTGSKAKLTIANRDTEGFCFDLDFDKACCRWNFCGNRLEEDENTPPLCVLVNDFLGDSWGETATELCAELKKSAPDLDVTPSTITKQLKSLAGLFKKEYHILIDFNRQHSGRLIHIRRFAE